MGRWGSELARLSDGRIVDATIPSKTDASALHEIQERIASSPLPTWETSDAWRAALLLPAACGPKLFANLAGSCKFTHEPANDWETAALSCFRDFRRAASLRFSDSYSYDVLKLASCFGANAYRRNAVRLRDRMVTVDEVAGFVSYIPPPPKYVPALLKDLYKMVHRPIGEAKAAMALAFYAMCHFIAIHPLGDGNGRSGRALFIRLASKGGVSVQLSSLAIALLHTKYIYLFHSSLMNYCLSGSVSPLAGVFSTLLGDLGRIVRGWPSEGRHMDETDLNADEIGHFRSAYCQLVDLIA